MRRFRILSLNTLRNFRYLQSAWCDQIEDTEVQSMQERYDSIQVSLPIFLQRCAPLTHRTFSSGRYPAL